MGKLVLTVIHRPEMVPEYLEKEAAQGKTEDIGRAERHQRFSRYLSDAAADRARERPEDDDPDDLREPLQRGSRCHRPGASAGVRRRDRPDAPGPALQEFREKYKTKDFCIWHFSMEDKREIVNDVFGKFQDVFGFLPQSTGSYYLDAELVSYIKSRYPMVTCAVATCWEEGPKAYHNANNSWYTLNDGGPWNPWIPSRYNIIAASGEEDDVGIVAIPHLSRDLLAVFDGPGSFLRNPSAERAPRDGVQGWKVSLPVQPDRSVPIPRPLQQRLHL